MPPRKRRAWFERYGPFLDAAFVNPEACKTGLNLIMFQTAIWFEIVYSLYTIKQASARIRRPTSQADVIEEIYINIPDTIVEDALSLVMDRLAPSGEIHRRVHLSGRERRASPAHRAREWQLYRRTHWPGDAPRPRSH